MTGSFRKPQVSIYTALLAIALMAVMIANIFAYLETADYEGDNAFRGAPSVVHADPIDRDALRSIAPGANAPKPGQTLTANSY